MLRSDFPAGPSLSPGASSGGRHVGVALQVLPAATRPFAHTTMPPRAHRGARAGRRGTPRAVPARAARCGWRSRRCCRVGASFRRTTRAASADSGVRPYPGSRRYVRITANPEAGPEPLSTVSLPIPRSAAGGTPSAAWRTYRPDRPCLATRARGIPSFGQNPARLVSVCPTKNRYTFRHPRSGALMRDWGVVCDAGSDEWRVPGELALASVIPVTQAAPSAWGNPSYRIEVHPVSGSDPLFHNSAHSRRILRAVLKKR
jgi:hypothetical protein